MWVQRWQSHLGAHCVILPFDGAFQSQHIKNNNDDGEGHLSTLEIICAIPQIVGFYGITQ